MVNKSVGTTVEKIAETDPSRHVLVVTNNDDEAIIYLSHKPNPSANDCMWILYPYQDIIFDTPQDHPERALFAISSQAATEVIVGGINEEK